MTQRSAITALLLPIIGAQKCEAVSTSHKSDPGGFQNWCKTLSLLMLSTFKDFKRAVGEAWVHLIYHFGKSKICDNCYQY